MSDSSAIDIDVDAHRQKLLLAAKSKLDAAAAAANGGEEEKQTQSDPIKSFLSGGAGGISAVLVGEFGAQPAFSSAWILVLAGFPLFSLLTSLSFFLNLAFLRSSALSRSFVTIFHLFLSPLLFLVPSAPSFF